MPKPKLDLLSVMRPEDGEWNPVKSVYDVRSPHAFTQVIGYSKHAMRKEGRIFFRGQSEMYPKMLPSLFRGATGWPGIHKRVEAIKRVVNQSSASFIRNTPEYAHEPLLQHYFLKTRWLDLVDNAWVALWFACHEVRSTGSRSEFAHFVQRESGFAYVILIDTGNGHEDVLKPGLVCSDKVMTIDLRSAAPSMYLRPHAQHGLLFRRAVIEKIGDADLAEFVVGVVRVDVKDALRWIGGSMLSVHYLFPPPHYDYGYRRFLEEEIVYDKFVGKTVHIGA